VLCDLELSLTLSTSVSLTVLTQVLPYITPQAAKKLAGCFPRLQGAKFVQGKLTYGLVVKETEDKLLAFARECPLLLLIEANGLWSRKWEVQTEDLPTEAETAKLASKFEADRKVFEKKLRTEHNIILLNSIRVW